MQIGRLVELFTEETRSRSGRVVDLFEDETRLFMRSVLHGKIEVAPGDFVEGGVALRLLQAQVSVRPYIFRLICTNGAVMALSDQARSVAVDSPDVEDRIREAIDSCASATAFEDARQGMIKTIGMRIDPGLAMTQIALVMAGRSDHRTLLDIMESFYEEGSDAFALMNAFTSIARRRSDPEVRWQLEEAGGSVPALLTKGVPSRSLEDYEELPIFEPDGVLQPA